MIRIIATQTLLHFFRDDVPSILCVVVIVPICVVNLSFNVLSIPSATMVPSHRKDGVTMDYSNFKVLFASRLSDGMTVSQIMEAFDTVAVSLDIRPEEPEILMMFLDAKEVEEKSKRTIKLYRSVLSRLLRDIQKAVSQIDTADIRHFLASCKQKGHKNVTLGNTRKILNCFFEWCILEGICTVNPVKRVASIKVEKSPRHAMKPIELEYLRNACESLRDKAMIDFLYSTGVRVSEFCHARIDNIDWEKKTVLIEHGKGDVTRKTYLNPKAEVSLRAYLDSRADDSPFIFARTKGKSDKPLDAKTVQDAVDRIVRAAGRSFSVRITPHVFRHTIATVLLRNGMPVEQVQRFLGHSNINTTMIYAEVRDEDVRRSHSLYAA